MQRCEQRLYRKKQMKKNWRKRAVNRRTGFSGQLFLHGLSTYRWKCVLTAAARCRPASFAGKSCYTGVHFCVAKDELNGCSNYRWRIYKKISRWRRTAIWTTCPDACQTTTSRRIWLLLWRRLIQAGIFLRIQILKTVYCCVLRLKQHQFLHWIWTPTTISDALF